MDTKFKRLLSLVIAMVMVMSLMPWNAISVLATEEVSGEEQVPPVTEGEEPAPAEPTTIAANDARIQRSSGGTNAPILENGEYQYYEHDKLGNSCHGTGDIYASAFVGSLVRGKTAYEAAKIAADYTVECIKSTAQVENHWYGAAFEPVLGKLIEMLK